MQSAANPSLCNTAASSELSFQPSSAEQGDQHVRELCDLDFGAHRTAEALPPCRPFMRPNRPRDRSHLQRRHRQDEPPGPITAQGCDRQAAGAKACRKACPPQDSKDLALKASAPRSEEHTSEL